MTTSETVKTTAPASADSTVKENGKLKALGGSESDLWNSIVVNQVFRAMWLKDDPEERDSQCTAAAEAMCGIRPRDELEGMMVAQLIAAHNAAMECHRRAMLEDQTFSGRHENLAQANKLSRTYVVLLEALNRHRGKGQQKVTVEHVHVHAGGQAVVGMVATSAGKPADGGAAKSEDQPHAKQIAHAPQPAVWCPDPGREAVPIPSDAERSMQNAWW